MRGSIDELLIGCLSLCGGASVDWFTRRQASRANLNLTHERSMGCAAMLINVLPSISFTGILHFLDADREVGGERFMVIVSPENNLRQTSCCEYF